jgi:hypothetical protein
LIQVSFEIMGVSSATLPLPDYGRLARHPSRNGYCEGKFPHADLREIPAHQRTAAAKAEKIFSVTGA